MTDLHIAAADIRRWSDMVQKRNRKGSDWCLKKGIGHEREQFKRADILPFRRIEAAEAALDRARQDAITLLASICHDCPMDCPLARK